MIDIKSCPLCGHEPVQEFHYDDEYDQHLASIECEPCDLELAIIVQSEDEKKDNSKIAMDEVVKKWNKRP